MLKTYKNGYLSINRQKMVRRQYSFDQIIKMKVLLTVLLLCVAFAGFSQTDDFRKTQFNLDDGVAVKGYDPVAYFTKEKAEKGKSAFSSSYHGVNYHFANAADL